MFGQMRGIRMPRLYLRRKRLAFLVGIVASCVCLVGLHVYGLFVRSASPRIASSHGSLDANCEAFFNAYEAEKTKFGSQNRQYIIGKVQEARLYGHCFIRHEAQTNVDVASLERKLFPMLQFSPTHQVATAEGKGIILELGPYSLDDANRLLRVLSELGNTLPIEIIHKGEIEDWQLAQMDKHHQDVRFINVRHLIPDEYHPNFRRFENKWLAFLLTSFEEIVYMDTDVVPFIAPNEFFEISQYVRSQSLFFRDRSIAEGIPARARLLYHKLLPSRAECDFFQMTMPDPPTLDGQKHHMESGLVVLNRTKYMPGLLVGTLLHLWEQTADPFWGDKELFWLGQSASGENGYEFNAYRSGAVGKFENLESSGPPSELSASRSGRTQNSLGRRLCSTHPAHFSDSLSLLWINGGLSECKWNSAEWDWNKYPALREKYASLEELTEARSSIIEIEDALILHESGSRSFFDLFRGSHGRFEKDEKVGCHGYYWCGFDTPEYPAITITFNDEQLRLIRRVSKAWQG